MVETLSIIKEVSLSSCWGAGIILASQFLKTPIIEEMKPLIKGKHPRDLAQEAIFYLEKMVNLHTDPVPAKCGDVS